MLEPFVRARGTLKTAKGMASAFLGVFSTSMGEAPRTVTGAGVGVEAGGCE